MSTSTFDDTVTRLSQGQAVADADLEQFAGTVDLITLGMLADDMRRQRHGAQTTFVRVADVPVDSVLNGNATWPAAAGEVRVTGAFTIIDEMRAAIRAVAQAAGDVPVSAFSLAELERAANGDVSVVQGWLEGLRAEGLGLVAEAPLDAMQDAPGLLHGAMAADLAIARSTMRHPPADGPLARAQYVARLQSATHAIRAFAPIPRLPSAEPTTGYEDVRAVALARIVLADVPHIQVDWMLHGPKLAQVALTFGADDVDNVSPLDEVAEGRRRAPLEEIRRNIRTASFEPVERDARFQPVD
jgi:aminodeoxyfutalosine synthase